MRQNILTGMFLLFAAILLAQHQDLQEKPKLWQSDSKLVIDTNSLLAAFKAGTVNGHFRYFLSSTDNTGTLTDYYANAVGGGLRYESAAFHGFSMGVSGLYIFDAGSSDLAKKDAASGQANRYEIGLFDVTDPENLNEINRVEEFFIKYRKAATRITFGRQLINTPFINLQDGRMRPTAVEGVWLETSVGMKHQFQGGWLYGIAPRGTSKWYSTAASIGIFPSGVNESGAKSDYAGNLETSGVALFNYQFKPGKGLTLNVWDVWVENVFNSALFQLDHEANKWSGKIYSGAQFIFQQKISNGGAEESSKSFTSNEKPVYTFGMRVGYKNKVWDHSLNFNRISESGRYLMPREWGRDPFFTFISRERNEGFGDLTAVVAKSTYTLKQRTSLQLAYGYFSLPDVKNYALNKYGLPSYTQLNIDFRHKFKGILNGFEGQILWVVKWNQGETYDTPKFIIHKVDMNLLNVVLNFRF